MLLATRENGDSLSQSAPRIPALLALGLLVVQPFLCNLHVTYHWSYLKLFALQLAVLVAWAGLLVVGRVPFRAICLVSGVTAPMLAVLAWGAFTSTWSRFPWAAIQPLVEFAYLALGVMAFAYILAESRMRRWFTIAYGVASALACLAYVASHVTWAETHVRVYPFENPNHAAAFAIIPVAAGAAYLISACLRRVPRSAGLLGGLVMCSGAAAIVASRSVAGLAAAAGALLLVAIFSFRGIIRRILIELVSTLAVVLALWPFLAPDLWPGWWLEEHAGARPAIWAGAARLAEERPLVGLGAGTFFLEYVHVHPYDYAAHVERSDYVESAHCVPLHLVCEVGLVGLALAGWLLWRTLRAARTAAREAGHVDRALLRGLVCGALAMLAHALVSDDIHQPEVYIQVGVALALIGGVHGIEWRRGAPAAPQLRLLRAAAGFALAVLFALTALPGLLSQAHLRLGTHVSETRHPPVEQRLDNLRRAVAHSWPTLSTIQAQLDLACLYDRTGRLQDALDVTRAADRLAPNFAVLRRNQADLARRLGRLDEAVKAITSYTRKDPFTRVGYLIWSEIFAEARSQGRPQLARPSEALRFLRLVETRDSPRLRAHEARQLMRLFIGA